MLCNFCFDYWMILLYSIPIFLCSKYYSIHKPCHLRCDSQISFFKKTSFLNPSTLSPKKSQRKNYWKSRKFRKKTIRSLPSIWHANPLDSCEIDKQIFIGMLGAILWLIEPLKTVLAKNQRPTQMMLTTVDGTVSTTSPVLSTD